ncbi:MAG: nuclear transport factor 2 family protein [Myxococcota bacterium]
MSGQTAGGATSGTGKALSAEALAREDAGLRGKEGAMAAARGWDRFSKAAQSTAHPRAEVEAACHEYVRRANINDWNLWTDIFTEDVLYVDHAYGVFRSREEVRKWMVPLMKTMPEMRFVPGFLVIQGDLVINYNWNRWPNPDGSAEPYDDWRNPQALSLYEHHFPCVTINVYGGNGLFAYEEDLYCAPAFMNIFSSWQQEWKAAGR